MIKQRIRKLEERIKANCGKGIGVVTLPYGFTKGDQDRAHKDYLANGGSPEDLFVVITKFSKN